MMNYIFTLLTLFFFSCQKTSSQDFEDKKQQKLHNNHLLLNENAIVQANIKERSLKIDAIEMVYVSTGSAYYSWLGHALLRLVGSGKTSDDDWTISFLPLFDTPTTDNIKAYYGGYSIFPVIKKWSEFVNEYVVDEDRYFERHLLKSNEEQRQRLSTFVIEMAKKPLELGLYSFKRLNCTYWQLYILEQAGIPVDKNRPFFPIDMMNYLIEEGFVEKTYSKIDRTNYLTDK